MLNGMQYMPKQIHNFLFQNELLVAKKLLLSVPIRKEDLRSMNNFQCFPIFCLVLRETS